MITTTEIQTALVTFLKASLLFEKVMTHADSDLGAALTHLRDNPASLAVIVPGADALEHELEPGTNVPMFSEVRSSFDVLISARELDARQSGAPKTLTLKDSLLSLLLWVDLGISDLVCLPTACDPLAIEFDNGKGREAWKLSMDFRQILTN